MSAALLAEPPRETYWLPTSVGAGRYEISGLIGEGRHKRVCLAFDRRLEREVALALVKPEAAGDIGYAKVRRETTALARLGEHPNIVAIYDCGEDGYHSLYFVTEYVDGGDLEQLIAAEQPGGVPLARVLDIAADVTRALQHIHECRLVHCDVKPGNVWLTRQGEAKLGDFGLARDLDRREPAADTRPVGTLAYMSPEQAVGKPADERSDLYSLGALIYELVCGRPPFTANEAAGLLLRHLYTLPTPPSRYREDLPVALEKLVLALLAKEPHRRPQSAREVLSTLEDVRQRSERARLVSRRLRRAWQQRAPVRDA
jgi:serine/threonine protein kinase